MESHFATEAVAHLRRRSLRAAAVNLIGPLTMLGGVAWAFVQPYRLTFLHPHGQGLWWLFSEPPLYVVLVGLGFAAGYGLRAWFSARRRRAFRRARGD